MFGALVAFAIVGGAALASDSSIQLNAGTGGPKADTDQLTTGAGVVQRGRTELAGAGASEIAVVASSPPAGTEYGLVTRNVPSGTQAVSGTFWQTTQPISAAALPLPSGAATLAKQPALGVAGTASADVITVQGIASMTALKVDGSGVTQPVSGSVSVANFPGTQPVSGTVTVQQATPASLTATVTQGPAGASAWKVDGSATTQPVSGTLTCNVGSSGALALDATLTGGTARDKITDGTNNAAVKAASTAAAATDPALVVAVSPNNSVAVTGTFFQSTQPVSGTVTAIQGTAAAASGAWPAKVTDGTNTAAVKAASTAAAAADPSLVCALSPNSPLPTGANTIGTVTAAQATAANLNATVVQATAANLNAQAVGAAANNASPVGNPLLDGAVAQADAANPTALTGGNLGYMRQDTQGRLFVRNYGSNLFTCSITTTATAVATIAGCLSPGAGLARYITDVYIGGGVATGATAAATLTTGTGTTCGTGTATLFRCDHSATANCITDQTTPIKAGVASDLCFTDAATGTKNVTITGYIAP